MPFLQEKTNDKSSALSRLVKIGRNNFLNLNSYSEHNFCKEQQKSAITTQSPRPKRKGHEFTTEAELGLA